MDYLSELPLSPEHSEMLRLSAISDEVIQARGYRTITSAEDLRQLGFASNQCCVPGLLLPLWTTDGENVLDVYRPDKPRVVEDKNKGRRPDGTYPNKVIKYEFPKGKTMRLDCPPMARERLANPSIPLWITEGQKKADALVSVGMCAISLLGVWNFRGKNSLGGRTFLADWDFIALNSREVRIVFDSDVMQKAQVRSALSRLTYLLETRHAIVRAVYLPPEPGKGKIGVDDWLGVGHTVEELDALVEAPRPAPKATPPLVELLDNQPMTMARPLALLDGHAYAAAWLPLKVTISEQLDKNGEVISFNPPLVKYDISLFVIRDDGITFGPGGDKRLEELSIEVRFSEPPPPDRTWTSLGVKAYRNGRRPSPEMVFRRVSEVIDRFIDFDRSLADQKTMVEAVACYVISTYFLDAFNVIGFIWPNGDRGSGKTHLLLVITELAYLGQLILAGGSFAALRDLADYGATLAFDDAEGLSDPKRTDPDKRALLLAGNRKGITVPLKEQNGDKTWKTRYVNAFCPRLFSAIRLPDPILASRTIVIPLIRTPDRLKANADPLDYEEWPHNRRELLDDLWALGLANLHEMQKWDDFVARHATLSGRNLQPWRSILAVAAWLDANGLNDMWERMDRLSQAYQGERPELEFGDLTVTVIHALVNLAIAKVANVTNVTNVNFSLDFTTSQITETVKVLAQESDGEIDPEKITTQRIGHVLKKMRLDKPPRPRGQKSRIWRVTSGDLERCTIAYGITLPEESQIAVSNPYTGIGNIGDIGSIGDLSETYGEDFITSIEDAEDVQNEDLRHTERIRQAQEYIDDWNSGISANNAARKAGSG